MTNKNDPMIKLEPGGKAPILSYNVPEPTSYSGSNYIELDIPQAYFKTNTKQIPIVTLAKVLSGADQTSVKNQVSRAMKTGFYDSQLFGNIRMDTVNVHAIEKQNPGMTVKANQPVDIQLENLNADIVTGRLMNKEILNIYQTMFGTYTYNFVPEPQKTRPRLMLVETYRLSSYLGNYGAGRTIKTFSLLPGEKTTISVETYTKTESTTKSASSIFDSFSNESSDDFEKSLQKEQSNKSAYNETFSYHAEAEAKASWGWGSAKVSGGVKGGSNSAREEFAKNASSATSKHAAKASAKRDVKIDTSYEVKEKTGVETSIQREIENINVSRTLNFVFRQMNQEFITLLHLVDVRVAFFNGFTKSYEEVSIPDLDSLLNKVLIASKVNEVRKSIVDELTYIYDYEDKSCSFIEEKKVKDKNGTVTHKYLRVKKDEVSKYKDKATTTEIAVPGIILSAKKYVLRTEGIIVDALLGQGNALDEYSNRLQEETNRAKTLANDLQVAKIKREEMGQKIIKDKDETAAEIYKKIFIPPVEVESE